MIAQGCRGLVAKLDGPRSAGDMIRSSLEKRGLR